MNTGALSRRCRPLCLTDVLCFMGAVTKLGKPTIIASRCFSSAAFTKAQLHLASGVVPSQYWGRCSNIPLCRHRGGAGGRKRPNSKAGSQAPKAPHRSALGGAKISNDSFTVGGLGAMNTGALPRRCRPFSLMGSGPLKSRTNTTTECECPFSLLLTGGNVRPWDLWTSHSKYA